MSRRTSLEAGETPEPGSCSGSCRGFESMRRWFWAALLGGASLTAVAVWLWTATPEACLAARFRGTIFQLLRGDAANTPEAWQGLMQEMSAFGIEELFLQWTSIDSLDFYYGHAGAGETIPLLPEIVRAPSPLIGVYG